MRAIFWSVNLKGRSHSEDLGIDGRIMLEWRFGEYEGRLQISWNHLITLSRYFVEVR
jgi:hypothetical protein